MASRHIQKLLREQLDAAHAHNTDVWRLNTTGEPLSIPKAGQAISSVYEQLRNAAEYSEGRIVLQRAIKRSLKRLLIVMKRNPEAIGQDLITELVLGGYLHANDYSSHTARAISVVASEHMRLYGRLRQAHVIPSRAQDWILSVLSVKVQDLLQPDAQHIALLNVAYTFFLEQLPQEQLVHPGDDADYPTALYVAVHRALLKTGLDVVRADLLRLTDQPTDDIHAYAAWHYRVDKLYTAALTLRLKRVVAKNSAPFHILKGLIEDNASLADLLTSREQFLSAYDYQISKEYQQTMHRLNRGLIKSIVFIFITKTLIGLGIEVPFDLFAYGSVALLPLVINLLFPPVYMASLRLGLTAPSAHDAQLTSQFMAQLLYGDTPPPVNLHLRTTPYSTLSQIASTLLFLVPFAVTVLLLRRLGFNPLQMTVFFVFFSTASFLGFLLSGLVRELRMSQPQRGLLAGLINVFSLPFILAGQWLAGKYARLNIIGEFLDFAIDLPLKTIIHLLHQWIRFVNEKYEEIA